MDAKKIKCPNTGMKWVKKIREELGLKPYGMAKLLGMIQQTYINLEDNARGCRMEVLVAIREKSGKTWEEIGKLIQAEVDDMKRGRKKS